MANQASYASGGGEAATKAVRSLRDLYLIRCGFSALWVALVLALASARTGGGTVSFLGGILLVAYPVSDAVATVVDLRRAAAGWPQLVNLGSDLVAVSVIGIAAGSGLADAIVTFGGWAVLSGVIMIILAARRQRVLHGQWIMIISGAGSVLAGISFTGWTGSPSAGLTALAQYSAGGAVWYLLTALWLWLRTRGGPAPGAPAQLPDAEPSDPRGHRPQAVTAIASAALRCNCNSSALYKLTIPCYSKCRS
jgi:uncharacterized membrane protein HdeD (DUF308 family)